MSQAGSGVLHALEAGSAGGTSVRKALQLLQAFQDLTAPAGVSELARRAGLSKSTAYRLLTGLEASGLVERVGCRYQLGIRAFELGSGVRRVRNREVIAVAFPYLCELFAQSRMVVQMGVVEDREVVILEQLLPLDGVRVRDAVGTRTPANAHALGKAILAFSGADQVREFLIEPLEARTRRTVTDRRIFMEHLRVTREVGVAVDIAENQLGLSSVAAPIHHQHRVVAAVSITAGSVHFDQRALAAPLQAMTARISAALLAA